MKYLVLLSALFLNQIAYSADSQPSSKRNFVGFQLGSVWTDYSPVIQFQENVGFEVLEKEHLYIGQFASFSAFKTGRSVLSLGPELAFRELFSSGLYAGTRVGIGYSGMFGPTYHSGTSSGGFSYLAGPFAGYDFILNKKKGRKFGLGAEVFLFYLSETRETISDSYTNSQTEETLPYRIAFSAVFSFKVFF